LIRLPNIRSETRKSMRHALRTRFRDSTARFLSLTPSFRRKERKMPANFCFGLRSSCPPAQLFFSQLLIVFEDRIFYRRTTRISVTSKFDLLRELPKYYLLTLTLFRNYVLFPQPRGKMPTCPASRFLYELHFSLLFMSSSLFPKHNTCKRKDVNEVYEKYFTAEEIILSLLII